MNNCQWQRSDASVPVKRRYTGALVDRQSLNAAPWKLKILQMEPMQVDNISALSGFQVTSFTPFIHSFIYSLTHSFIYSFIYSFIHSFIHSFVHSFIYSLIHSFIHLLTHSFIHLFIHSDCCSTMQHSYVILSGRMIQRCVAVCLVFLQSTLQPTDDEVHHWKVECGKPLNEIHSSPFCNKDLLASYCEFLHNFEVHFSHISVNTVI